VHRHSRLRDLWRAGFLSLAHVWVLDVVEEIGHVRQPRTTMPVEGAAARWCRTPGLGQGS
jgi:hypothetical protein